jgi:hypothetical protein
MGSSDIKARRRPAKAASPLQSDLLPHAVMSALFLLFALGIAVVLHVVLSRAAFADETVPAPRLSAAAEAAAPLDAYALARLRAGQSWDSGRMSISELRPGAVDRAELQTYVAAMGKADPTLVAAAGPQLVVNSDILTQTASAAWGAEGIIPRSHMAGDGAWEFPRLPDQDEQDLLVGQRWRLVENEESQILFLGPDRRFGWDDLADLINPLQHIPLVNVAYRSMTGDEMYGAGRLLDLGFGPLAGASTVFELAYRSTTGEDLEYEAVAAVFGPMGRDDDVAALYAGNADQTADIRNRRRGSNQ